MRASIPEAFTTPFILSSTVGFRRDFLSIRESTVFDPMKRWLMTGCYRRGRETISKQSPYSFDISTRGVGTPTPNIRSEAYRRKQAFGFTISNTMMRLDIRKDSRSEQHLGGVSVARHSIRIHLIRQWCLLLLFLPSSTKMRACGCRIFGIVFAC